MTRTYQAGDEVTVRGTIYHPPTHREPRLGIKFDGGAAQMLNGIMVVESAIVEHKPTPRQFVEGDLVTWGRGNINWTFVAQAHGIAFIKSADATHMISISELSHADADSNVGVK